MSEGNPNAKIAVVTGVPSWERRPLTEIAKSLFLDTAKRAGIRESDFSFHCVLGEIPPGRKEASLGYSTIEGWKDSCRERLRAITPNIFVPIGNLALSTLTKHTDTSKWHLSIIPGDHIGGRKTLPLIHPESLFKSYKDIPFLIFGMQRLKTEMESATITSVNRTYNIKPSFEFAMAYLERCVNEEYLSVDIETRDGQITCIGFAPNPLEGICIPVLPGEWTDAQLFHIWKSIAKALTGPARKVFQNFIYDATYLSKYGIAVRNLYHDTMLAQKFLHPELPMGLDTVARIYTREPYWKDEGKDWKLVKDYDIFYTYNVKDCTVTLEAAHAQRLDLKARGIERAFETLVMRMSGPAAEMCWRGLPVDLVARTELTTRVEAGILQFTTDLNTIAQPIIGKALSARSPKQVKEFFRAKGYRLPVKKGKETSDVTALLKLQQKYPNDPSLPILLQLSEKNKLLSSYLKPLPYPDGRFRFSLVLHGAETGRWSCKKDPWDNGINAQTISSELKKMFRAPPGWVFLETDLRQADARYVAWDAPEPTLIKFFNEGRDIHKFVASRPEMFNKSEDLISKDERQLGKKTGHAANYGMRGQTHSDACLLEMGIVIAPHRAQQMLDGYHRTFPGIGMRQQRIQSEIRRTKKLSTPMGRERYFYDRIGDDLYRQAYAYQPQSVVADVINKLIVHVDDNRNPELLHHALQAHDAGIFLCHESYIDTAVEIINSESDWNPKISLPGGILVIPIETKVGEIWGKMKEIV